MACVNRVSNDIFLPCLYTFNVRRQESSALIWAAQNNTIALANRLLRNIEQMPTRQMIDLARLFSTLFNLEVRK
jgi:hypothetical protein